MNDNELSTMVRESVADVHSATPVAEIISRGRTVRARRRIPGVAGALALAAGTALAVTTLLPFGHPAPAGSGHPDRHPVTARLAAWTVAKQANGDIHVTIRQLKNPAGLQSTLRADGLPVRVSYSKPRPPIRVGSYRGHPAYMFTGGVAPGYHGPAGVAPKLPCKFYPSRSLLNAVVHFSNSRSPAVGFSLVIKPSALPTGAGLAMFLGGSLDDIMPPSSVPPGTDGAVEQSMVSTSKDGRPRVEYSVNVTPVYASQQCTG